MAGKSRALSLNELRHLQWLLGCILSVLAAGTVLFLEVEAFGLLLALMVVAGIAAFRPTWPSLVPRLAHRLVVPLVLLVFGFDLWTGEGLLASLTRLTLLLLAYRCACYRRRREDLQLILLGLFLVVVAGVLTVSLAFAVLLVLFTLCALGLLFVVTIADAMAPDDEPVAGPGVFPSWAERAGVLPLCRRLVQVLDWRQALVAGLLFLFLVIGSAGIFVVIPRFQIESSLFIERFFPRKVKSGFSENVRLGEVSDITQDFSLALSVDVPEGVRLEGSPYLRMLVLDEYSSEGGFRLSAALRKEGFGPENSSASVRGTYWNKQSAPSIWTFYLEPGVSRYMPMVGPFQGMQFRDPQTYRHAGRLNLVALRSDPLAMVAYRVDGPLLSDRMADAEFAARFRAAPRDSAGTLRDGGRFFLGLPLSSADRASLLQQVPALSREAGAEAFSAAVSAMLAGRHAYSLQSSVSAGSGDVVVRWIQGGGSGHCELFASSFVLLARAAGYPCRLVTGYHGGTWNGFSNNLVVRNSDAHAWCEIWDGNGAWLRVDPTPGARAVLSSAAAEDVRSSRLDRSLSARFDSYRIFWYRRIVNFDQQSQVSAMLSLKALFDDLRNHLQQQTRSLVTGLRAGFQGAGTLPRSVWLWGLACFSGAAGLSWLCVSLYRRWGVIGRPGRHDPVRREAGRLLLRYRNLKDREAEDIRIMKRLERLRYGPPGERGVSLVVFDEAKRRLRRRPSPSRRQA